jgi:hypothetical protein
MGLLHLTRPTQLTCLLGFVVVMCQSWVGIKSHCRCVQDTYEGDLLVVGTHLVCETYAPLVLFTISSCCGLGLFRGLIMLLAS